MNRIEFYQMIGTGIRRYLPMGYGEYYLTDLNSRNGTSVNGQILKNGEDRLLEDEDEVDFAQARYIFLK